MGLLPPGMCRDEQPFTFLSINDMRLTLQVLGHSHGDRSFKLFAAPRLPAHLCLQPMAAGMFLNAACF